jgi:hypothetical protein
MFRTGDIGFNRHFSMGDIVGIGIYFFLFSDSIRAYIAIIRTSEVRVTVTSLTAYDPPILCLRSSNHMEVLFAILLLFSVLKPYSVRITEVPGSIPGHSLGFF